MIERCAIDAESRGGAGWTTDHPFGLAEHSQDVFAFD